MKTAIEKELQALAQKAFESHSWNFFPTFPNILIRVFDFEEATTGRIIKPQTAQAPNHRAIVVRVWAPKQVTNKFGVERTIESEFTEGDLVTVPYYTGVPTGVEDLDDAGYRVTKENIERKADGNYIRIGADQSLQHIFYKCGLFNKREAVKDIITTVYHNVEYLPDEGHEDNSEGDIRITIDEILSKYDIVPKKVSFVESTVHQKEE